MPVTPITLTPSLISQMGAVTIAGTTAPQLAQAIAAAFTSFLAQVGVVTTHIGVLGVGQGYGKVIVEPASGIAIMSTNMAGQGFLGTYAQPLGTAIILALTSEIIANADVSVTIVGTSTGAGSGALTGLIPASLHSLLIGSLSGAGIIGSKASDLASVIANSLCTWLQSAVITTTDIGVPAFPYSASVGTGIGKVF